VRAVAIDVIPFSHSYSSYLFILTSLYYPVSTAFFFLTSKFPSSSSNVSGNLYVSSSSSALLSFFSANYFAKSRVFKFNLFYYYIKIYMPYLKKKKILKIYYCTFFSFSVKSAPSNIFTSSSTFL